MHIATNRQTDEQTDDMTMPIANHTVQYDQLKWEAPWKRFLAEALAICTGTDSRVKE